jgi:hypothetical protein
MSIEIKEIVDKQLAAYNEGDYENFIIYYDPNIISFSLETGKPNPMMSGPNFFAHYKKKFLENSRIHCQVVQRIVYDDLVIDKEIISNHDNRSHSELVLYQIEGGRIAKMWFSKEMDIGAQNLC